MSLFKLILVFAIVANFGYLSNAITCHACEKCSEIKDCSESRGYAYLSDGKRIVKRYTNKGCITYNRTRDGVVKTKYDCSFELNGVHFCKDTENLKLENVTSCEECYTDMCNGAPALFFSSFLGSKISNEQFVLKFCVVFLLLLLK